MCGTWIYKLYFHPNSISTIWGIRFCTEFNFTCNGPDSYSLLSMCFQIYFIIWFHGFVPWSHMQNTEVCQISWGAFSSWWAVQLGLVSLLANIPLAPWCTNWNLQKLLNQNRIYIDEYRHRHHLDIHLWKKWLWPSPGAVRSVKLWSIDSWRKVDAAAWDGFQGSPMYRESLSTVQFLLGAFKSKQKYSSHIHTIDLNL